MIDRLIEDHRDLNRLLIFLQRKVTPFRVTVTDGRPRSYDQNRLQWMWAAEAAAQRNDMTASDVQAEWKLQFGVPILMAEHPAFAEIWKEMEPLPYQTQLRLIHFVSVSSLMSVTQLKTYLDQVLQWNTENDIELTVPEELRHGSTSQRVDRKDPRGPTTIVGAKTYRTATKRKVP